MAAESSSINIVVPQPEQQPQQQTQTADDVPVETLIRIKRRREESPMDFLR